MAAVSSLIAAGSAIAGAYGAKKQSDAAKDAAGQQLAAQKQAASQAELERARAETEAAQANSSALAQRNRARKASSLLARDQGDGVMGGTKTKLGE